LFIETVARDELYQMKKIVKNYDSNANHMTPFNACDEFFSPSKEIFRSELN
jgi:hypothetical protein